MAETWKAHDAFEYYYSLGPGRTMKEVAKHYKCSVGNILRWSQKNNWVARARERDKKNMLAIEEQNNIKFVEEMMSYKKLIKASVMLYVQALKKKHVEVNSVKDLDKLVRLDIDVDKFINESNSSQEQLIDNAIAELTEDANKKVDLSAESNSTISNILKELTSGKNSDVVNFANVKDLEFSDNGGDANA